MLHTEDQRATIVFDPLIVIPSLNEAFHIGRILRQLIPAMHRLGGRIVVVDGGSNDGTQRIVKEFAAAEDRVSFLDNPKKIQSAAINLAVARDQGRATHLIRIDAHCAYPDDYCDVLVQQAKSVYTDSIVVSMIAKGHAAIQRINAATQNAPIGNGGSAHRVIPSGEYVEHGHHALIKLAAFRAIGGYDETFSHNEDAEFDYRLRQAGYRIWLSSATLVTYFPRRSLKAIANQYFNFGMGRARNLTKHNVLPRLRQTKVMMVLPTTVLAVLSFVHWTFALPALIWCAYCLLAGARLAWRERDTTLVLCGLIAMVMHFSWSLGFWTKLFVSVRPHRFGALQ